MKADFVLSPARAVPLCRENRTAIVASDVRRVLELIGSLNMELFLKSEVGGNVIGFDSFETGGEPVPFPHIRRSEVVGRIAAENAC